MGIINTIRHHFKKVSLANEYLNNEFHLHAREKFVEEIAKRPFRTDIINYVLTVLNRETAYLEIGVRNPEDNFVKINSAKKYSVDPGYENSNNNVDFKLTSNEFFEALKSGNILVPDIAFDVIFIDGSHFAEQVELDIQNALSYLKEDGFIIMHDCNPPTQYHASENYNYRLSPAKTLWNGTTWKAFVKNRQRTDIHSCCIDTDWGIGVISKHIKLGNASTVQNEFFEFNTFDAHRRESLNLMNFEEFKQLLSK